MLVLETPKLTLQDIISHVIDELMDEEIDEEEEWLFRH
jgi:hypothetical protein